MNYESDNPVPVSTLRTNPLTEGHDRQVVVSPQRMMRPWSGKVEDIVEPDLPVYDESCPLCPGNQRQNGDTNPCYTDAFVFPNDNPAFVAEHTETGKKDISVIDQIFFADQPVRGLCEVLVYSPDHQKMMMHMTQEEIQKVIEAWSDRYRALGALPFIQYVAEFETRGKELGNSMPHAHGQIWAAEHIPPRAATEIRKQQELTERLGDIALLQYVDAELEREQRLVYQNDSFAAVVPPWAKWPYEIMALPKVELGSVDQCNERQVADLAKVLGAITRVYALLFQRPKYGAPYMLAVQQKPTDGRDYPDFQMHVDFKPNLLSPTRQKFIAGYEELFGYQRDLTPETAAQTLKTFAQAL